MALVAFAILEVEAKMKDQLCESARLFFTLEIVVKD
jgi:hypothetical protein